MKSDSSFDSEASSDSDKIIVNNKKEEDNKINNIEIIKSISDTLSTILEKNKKIKNYKEILINQNTMCFSSYSIPNITIYEYLIRIQKYTLIEKNTLILSLIYIDRICQLNKILFASILIAIKYNEDEFYENKFYAEIAGIKVTELIIIEYNFFCMCDFNLYVEEDIFLNYSRYLDNHYKINNDNS